MIRSAIKKRKEKKKVQFSSNFIREREQSATGFRFSKVLKLFGPEKPLLIRQPAYSVKLAFSCVVKGIKIKITEKFRATRRLSFEDTKRIMSPEMSLKSFGTVEKLAPVFIVIYDLRCLSHY